MKVSAVSFNSVKTPGFALMNNTNTVHNQYLSQGFPSQSIVANYNHINFSGDIQINEEYFKLPIGAKPDEYQINAAKELQKGNSVLVSAPTGTGKTAIAQYIISKNLEEGKKTFYTTPLKALSNQKLLEFRKIYGDDNVGILTGDRKENANAPIVIMTTEVYRNMAFDRYFNNSENLSNSVNTVIFDEFHYLGDKDRGASWEESILFSPPQTQVLGLSATIGNDGQLSSWLDKLNNKNVKLVHVPSMMRHVPLLFYGFNPLKNDMYAMDPARLKDTMPKDSVNHANSIKRKNKNYEQKVPYSSDYISLVNKLSREKMLPAILFVFNKKYSASLLDAFEERGADLTTEDEKKKISGIIDEYEKEYGYIGYDMNKDALLKGYAVHNAGILPIQKELIEELFNKKLLKTVIATETLAAGINMPAKTVVISSCDKPTSDPKAINGRRNLTANEFHQMAGRAGRRGIDNVGYVVTMNINPQVEDTFKSLVASDPNPVYSVFNPNYSLIANYHKYTKNSDKIRDVFAKSFKIYSSGGEENVKKINSMYNKYEHKVSLMEEEGFLQVDNHKKILTPKGMLVPNIIGYPQLPLINLITSHALANMTPQELVYFAASIVGGQYHTKNISDEELFSEKVFPSDYIKSDINSISRGSSVLLPDLSILNKVMGKYDYYNKSYIRHLLKYSIVDENSTSPNLQVGSLVYLFAYLNSVEGANSINNWQTITKKFAPDGVIRDEGSYYNIINQTIDLLGQMIDLCKDTKNVYELKDDGEYYDFLAHRLKKAVKLLKQEPMQNYIYEE